MAEVCDRDHEDLLTRLGWEEKLRTLVPRDVSARMLVQCARHPQVSSQLRLDSINMHLIMVCRGAPTMAGVCHRL